LYGPSRFPWTAALPWGCVYSVADFGGSLAAAQAAALAGGGGVVFLPPGTHALEADFVLASGVLLRGADTGAARALAPGGRSPGLLAPASRLVCPPGRHLSVRSTDANASGLGVVQLELDGCSVLLWPALTGPQVPPAFDLKRTWADATGVAGMGSRKLVLSVLAHDVGLDDPNAPWHNYTTSNRWPWPYGVAVSVYSDAYALVANTAVVPARHAAGRTTVSLRDPQQPAAPPRVLTVPYPTDNRYGIDVNNMFIRKPCAAQCGGDQPLGGWAPHCCPWAFRPGLAVVDNYVFQNGRVGISWSGGANESAGGDAGGSAPPRGSGAQVIGNHVTVAQDTVCWSHDGVRACERVRACGQAGAGACVPICAADASAATFRHRPPSPHPNCSTTS